MPREAETFGYIIRYVTPPHKLKRWGLPVRGTLLSIKLSLLWMINAAASAASPSKKRSRELPYLVMCPSH
jgi:hypothetical protein